jgi:lysozyme
MARDDTPEPQKPKAGTLAAIVGTTAAAALFVSIPHDESGRTVEATVAPDGTATVRHVKGKQYLDAYVDIAGVPTACDGITRGVRMGQRYTEAECAALLEKELVIHARGVMNCTPGLSRPGTDNQRIAAVSLAYNIGVGAWCGSTAARRFNAGDYRGGCDAMLRWDKARVNGVLRPVKGLTTRRKKEHAVCIRGLA